MSLKLMSRVGLNTAQLTDEERIYIDDRIVETVRPKLVGRRLVSGVYFASCWIHYSSWVQAI